MPTLTVLLATKRNNDASKIQDSLAENPGAEASVIVVGSAEELETRLLELESCIVVADWNMPGVPELVGALKSDEAFESIPVMAILATEDERYTRSAFACGADVCVHYGSSQSVIAGHIGALVKSFGRTKGLLATVSDMKSESINYFLLLDLLRKYVPMTVWDLANLLAREQRLEIPEREMELTIVFSDIKDFTRITQHMQPRQIIEGLNAVFEIVSDCIYRHRGDIDKFIGDAFFAVFAVAENAVEATVEIQERMEAMNKAKTDGEPFNLRIGVHTGRVIRGNVGGGGRFDNTLIGDTVNAASRLETLAPPGGILVSEQTCRKASITVPEELGTEVSLRGRDRKIKAYNVFPYLRDRLEEEIGSLEPL